MGGRTLGKVATAAIALCAAVTVGATSSGADLSSVGHWATTVLPAPAGAVAPRYSTVASVSCTTMTNCVTVGGSALKGSNFPGIVHTKVASGWIAQALPLPNDVSSSIHSVTLRSVSCTGSFCAAVGNYPTAGGNRKAVIYTRSSGIWHRVVVKVPSDDSLAYPDSDLESVTCLSPTRCIGVGNYQSTAGQPGLAVIFNGTTWTPVRLPIPTGVVPSDPTVTMAAVSCPTASNCVSVGTFYGADHTYHPVAITLNGPHWSVVTLSLPKGVPASGSVVLSAISCPSTTSCTAGGSVLASTTTHSIVPFVETRTGATWTASLLPLPKTAAPRYEQATINAISCASPSLCVAGGSFDDANYIQFAGLWSKTGGTWHTDTFGAPVNGIAASIQSINCLSATSCVLAGNTAIEQSISFAFVANLTPLTAMSSSVVVAANHTNVSAVRASALGALHVALVSGPSHGTVSLSPNGNFTYTPKAKFVGVDSFRFTAVSGALTATTATETLVVRAYKVPTVSPAASSSFQGQINQFSIANRATGFGTLSFHLSTGPTNGTVTVLSTGVVIYTPNPSFTGTDTFTFTVRDPFGGTSKPGTVTLTVH